MPLRKKTPATTANPFKNVYLALKKHYANDISIKIPQIQ
jgi:hypothetical protein